MKLNFTAILFLLLFNAAACKSANDTNTDYEEEPELPSNPSYQLPDIITNPSESFYPVSRLWQGIPGIAKTKGGRLFASIYSGGTQEPHKENYAIYMVSDNDGAIWIDPFLIVDHPHEDVHVFDPSLQVDPLGRLWICWNQRVETPRGTPGWWAIRIDDPDAPLEELKKTIAQTKPVRIATGLRINKFIVLDNGEWLQPVSHTGTTGFINIYISADQGKTWKLQGRMNGMSSITEPMAVQKENSHIWLLIRTTITGGIGQSFSYDYGKKWTAMADNLPEPLRGPQSRFYLSRLKSGALLFVNNASETERRDMTAYLSCDDGETWPYSLLLDDRYPSYPDGIQDEEGNVYVVWDYGRGTAGELVLSVFTENDIKNGAFGTGSRSRVIVSKLY